MPVISEKYVMEIKIISSQPKGVMAQDEKIRFGSKGLCMVAVKLKKENKKEFTVVEGLIIPCFKPIYTPFPHSAISFSPPLSSSHSCLVFYPTILRLS